MQVPFRKCLVAFACCVAFLSSCSDVHDPLVQVNPTPSTNQASMNPSSRAATKRASVLEVAGVGQAAAGVQRVQEAVFVIAVGKGLAERSAQVATARRTGSSRPAVATTGSLDSVVACIYAHESGNFSESSHPSSGSGAAQWIPSTWRAWSARAGYPGYAYAYQAPASVQEAVLRYALNHGGAGNWSNKFGNDPCTQGMGG